MSKRCFHRSRTVCSVSQRILATLVFLTTHTIAGVVAAAEDPLPVIIKPPVPTAPPSRTEMALPANSGESTEQWELFFNQLIVRNVNQPTLYPVLPDLNVANDRAVIVIPGGGYNFVSIENEGFPVAQALAEAGYSAFVLKYRTTVTDREPEGFLTQTSETFRGLGKTRLQDHPPAVADLASAIAAVQQHCEKKGCDPEQIGVIGFSAGARSIIRLLESHPAAADLHNAALIYPPTIDAIVAPDYSVPLFVAIAADDPLFKQGKLHLPEAWLANHGSLEFHLYAEGGHGFGTLKDGVTASHWAEPYLHWLARVDALPVRSESP